ncbi:hypothetical protein P9112_012738 [Eukaryota sp. TZLM1-RC]
MTALFEELWDRVPTVQARTKDSEKVLSYLDGFFEEVQKACGNFAKHIQRIQKHEHIPSEPHVVAQTTAVAHQHFLKIADSFAHIEEIISSSISNQVSAVKKDFATTSKKLRNEHNSIAKNISSERSRLETLRKGYIDAASHHEHLKFDAESARLQLVPDVEVSRKVKLANDAEKVLSNADAMYRDCVERVRQLEEQNDEVITRVLNGHQKLEETCITQSQAWLTQLCSLMSSLPEVVNKAVSDVRGSVSCINKDAEIQSFTDRHYTSAQKPTHITYVPYMPSLGTPSLVTPQVDDTGVSGLAPLTDMSSKQVSSDEEEGGGLAVVQYDYAADDTDETSIVEGEEVVVLSSDSDGWIMVKSRAGEGLVPTGYLRF